MEKNISKYEDMIELPYRKSTKHPHMSMIDRAAQFSPFAALTGHDAAIQETARRTEARIELDEDMKIRLDRVLQEIVEKIASNPRVTATYFKEDEKKEGGSYLTVTGQVKRLDAYRQKLVFKGGQEISIGDIMELQYPKENGK